MTLEVGQNACVRDVVAGQASFVWPVTVEEAGERLLVSQVAGAIGMVPEGYPEDRDRVIEQAVARRWTLVDRAWQHTNCLHIVERDQWWGTRLMWFAETDEFLGWYVDFKLPVRIDGACLSSRDLQLDVVVGPAGNWSWKDEDHYEMARTSGFISDDEHENVEAARAPLVVAIEAGDYPFDGTHLEWRPAHPVPMLPADWAVVD